MRELASECVGFRSKLEKGRSTVSDERNKFAIAQVLDQIASDFRFECGRRLGSSQRKLGAISAQSAVQSLMK